MTRRLSMKKENVAARRRRKMNHASPLYNAWGLTFSRWLAAARKTHSSKHITALRAAWMRGEDPTEYA